MSGIRCILFDLGGVVTRFRGVERVAKWAGDAAVGERHWRRWLRSEAVRAFELGRLSPEQFAVAFVEELGLSFGPEELLGELDGFISGPLEGATELLDELRPLYLVACLSNTNRRHWPRIRDEKRLGERFHRTFLSFETGLLKPDLEAFEGVCHELELAPAEILFFDDARLNVEAARAYGLEACRVHGPADCRRELERRGLLPHTRPKPGDQR